MKQNARNFAIILLLSLAFVMLSACRGGSGTPTIIGAWEVVAPRLQIIFNDDGTGLWSLWGWGDDEFENFTWQVEKIEMLSSERLLVGDLHLTVVEADVLHYEFGTEEQPSRLTSEDGTVYFLRWCDTQSLEGIWHPTGGGGSSFMELNSDGTGVAGVRRADSPDDIHSRFNWQKAENNGSIEFFEFFVFPFQVDTVVEPRQLDIVMWPLSSSRYAPITFTATEFPPFEY